MVLNCCTGSYNVKDYKNISKLSHIIYEKASFKTPAYLIQTGNYKNFWEMTAYLIFLLFYPSTLNMVVFY